MAEQATPIPHEDEPAHTADAGLAVARAVPLWRRLVPVVVAIALMSIVLSRLDWQAFRAAISGLNVPAFLGFTLVWVIVLLGADAVGSVAAYRVTVPGARVGQFYVLRGASYLPGLLNHHLGQAFLTYTLARAFGVPLARMTGATLLAYAGWMGCLLGVATVALPVAGKPAAFLLLPLGAGIVYLAILALKPQRLASIRLLSPLFEAGLKGHAVALFARVPHLVVLILGTWLPFYFFDVAIPVGPALLFMPVVLVAVTLPLTPQGFGTRDALSVAFFSTYAAGATEGERAARIAACTTTWGVVATLMSALVGLVCARWASRWIAQLSEQHATLQTPAAAEASGAHG